MRRVVRTRQEYLPGIYMTPIQRLIADIPHAAIILTRDNWPDTRSEVIRAEIQFLDDDGTWKPVVGVGSDGGIKISHTGKVITETFAQIAKRGKSSEDDKKPTLPIPVFSGILPVLDEVTKHRRLPHAARRIPSLRIMLDVKTKLTTQVEVDW